MPPRGELTRQISRCNDVKADADGQISDGHSLWADEGRAPFFVTTLLAEEFPLPGHEIFRRLPIRGLGRLLYFAASLDGLMP
jgi:hypothetical protein